MSQAPPDDLPHDPGAEGSVPSRTADGASYWLSAIIDSAEDAIIGKTLDGVITSWNKAAERIFGYTAEEIIGKPISMLIPTDHTDEEPSILASLRRGERIEHYETVRVRKDGSLVDISLTVSPVRGPDGQIIGASKIARDITERKRAEEALRQREEELTDFIENSVVGLHWVGSDGTILWANQAELDLLGYTREEYVGRNISEVHADPHVIKDILARLTRDEALHSYEARLRCKDGSIRHVLISSNVRRQDGKFVHTRCFTRDITERRRADALLSGQNRVLELIAQGAALSDVLDALVRAIEEQSTEGVLASILLLDRDGLHLRHGAAPSLPASYNQAIDGIAIGPSVGSCGTAAYLARQVVVTDIASDPLWADFKELATEHGLRACWSTPIFSTGGRVLGTFAMYYREPRAPAERDLRLISMVTRTAAIAIERKQAEEALRDSEERYRLAMRATHDVVWDWNMVRDEVFWSESLHTVFGYPPEQAGVIIRDAFEWWTSRIHPDDRERVGESFQRAASAGQSEWIEEYRFLRADGTYVEVGDAAFIVFDREGRPVRMVGAMADITERKRAEAERERLLARETELRARAEEASRLKDEFLATISHELRTPLTAILGWAHMLRTGQFAEGSTTKALETIERNARAQAQLIEDLLDVSRIITGKLRLDVRRVEPTSFVDSAVEALRPAAEAKGVRVQKVLDTGIVSVSGDPARLQQVVWNLLSNAVKFTPKGGRVQVRVERVNSHIEIIVSDTGVGIEPEFLPHVFDRFRQADGSTTKQYGGLGLGLSIVRHLVEMHGGTVRAESEGAGRGSTFTVMLPVTPVYQHADAGERVQVADREPLPYECPDRLDGLRLLVVDDEADTCELLKAGLERCGADVTTAGSAAEALAELSKSQPDVLISDIGMPGEDGYELIRKVRGLPAESGGRVPAIALTAYARTEDRMQALRAGYHMHVTKPVELAELAAIVASLALRAG
jgi:PAS domain S-box-containing protein